MRSLAIANSQISAKRATVQPLASLLRKQFKMFGCIWQFDSAGVGEAATHEKVTYPMETFGDLLLKVITICLYQRVPKAYRLYACQIPTVAI